MSRTDSLPSPVETVADRILSETVIGPAAAARRLGEGRRGRPVHPATVTRWIMEGVRRSDGTRVRLEAVKAGSAWRTSVEALARFVAALTPPTDGTSAPLRTVAGRRRASEAAAAE
ncbi:MAG TPA: DUF1580 domain-containing protein, partial [Gemmataceae bacterium]